MPDENETELVARLQLELAQIRAQEDSILHATVESQKAWLQDKLDVFKTISKIDDGLDQLTTFVERTMGVDN